MSPKAPARPDTRTALLEVGMEIMLEKGYTNTGIQEILTALQVPKGSFYHYFDSKESYAVEVIRHCDHNYSANLMRILRNPGTSPLNRLKAYVDDSINNLREQNFCKGCLIGRLSQEMADQSELLREELSLVLGRRRDIIAACMQEGQQLGEITKKYGPAELAELFHCGLSGASMQAKTLKTSEPMELFKDIFLMEMLSA